MQVIVYSFAEEGKSGGDVVMKEIETELWPAWAKVK
jgi:hypothetical protein